MNRQNIASLLVILPVCFPFAWAAEDKSIILSDDFDSSAEFEKNWTVTTGHATPWEIKDGALIIKQTNPDHGAVVRRDYKFADIDMQIDFRFSGGKSFNFVFDDKKEKSVHAGHICRVSIWPTKLNISDDKTGSMNLEVQAKRKDKNLPQKEQKALDETLEATRSMVSIETKSGKWHTLRVVITGDLMEAYLDGKLATKLKSPGFAHPTKTMFGMTVNGASLDFDNLKVTSLSK